MEPVQRIQPIEQLRLFDMPRILPRWEDLPLQTRQEAVQLLEKILVDYGHKTVENRTTKKGPSNE